MGYAWAPQITGLIRGEPQPGQKHRSNGLAILMECCEERASKSETLDRSRSGLNHYWHRDSDLVSGTAAWDDICAEADAYKVPVKLKNGKTAERGLPHNAVIGWAMIVKPPLEMIAELDMTDKDIRQFCADGFMAMCEIEPRLFRRDNMAAMATHRDEEGTHVHIAGVSRDTDGRYCGNLVDAALCVRINEEFPRIMRGKGWPIDDIDLTDWERMKTDEAYRKEREAKRKRQGQSLNRYAKSRAENAGRVAAQIITDAKDKAQAIRADAEHDAAQVTAQAVQDAREAGLTEAAKWERGVLMAQQQKAGLEREIGDMREYQSWKAQKAAQEAEEAAKREQEEQEAREAEERRVAAQKAQEEARREEDARKAAQAAQEAARPKTPEEMYLAARAAINGGRTATQEPPRRKGPSLLEQMRRKTEASTRDAEPDGPSYPGA